MQARSENTVWRAVEYWCRARPDREQYFKDFVQYIKFPLMTPDFLRDVVSMSDKLSLCKTQYDEAMFYHAASSNRKKYITQSSGFQYTARCPGTITIHETIFKMHPDFCDSKSPNINNSDRILTMNLIFRYGK